MIEALVMLSIYPCSTCNRSIGTTRHSSSSVVASFVLTVAMGATLGAEAFKERERADETVRHKVHMRVCFVFPKAEICVEKKCKKRTCSW